LRFCSAVSEVRGRIFRAVSNETTALNVGMAFLH